MAAHDSGGVLRAEKNAHREGAVPVLRGDGVGRFEDVRAGVVDEDVEPVGSE